MNKIYPKSSPLQNRTICLSFDQETYNEIIEDAYQFRLVIDKMIVRHPELFPTDIVNGYRMKDTYMSRKLGIKVRRITMMNISYTVRPSFILPYMTGKTDEVEKGLFLRKFDVPFWAVSHVFGRDPMYWERIEQSMGKNSIVGTTVKNEENLPKNIIVDEKHTRLRGKKVYIPTTVGNECILSVSVTPDAGEHSLENAYGRFKNEARNVCPDYEPLTINTDGWKATRKTMKKLFPSAALLLCFLHVFISIRDRAKKKFKDIFQEIGNRLWNCYEAESKGSFVQRVRRLYEWGINNAIPSVILEKIEKLYQNLGSG